MKQYYIMSYVGQGTCPVKQEQGPFNTLEAAAEKLAEVVASDWISYSIQEVEKCS